MNSADIFLQDSKPVKENNMTYVHMFQWNIPADNHFVGETNGYINIIAEWDGRTTYGRNNTPLVIIKPVNATFYDLVAVKDWSIARTQIERIAEDHFASIAKAERIAQARATLISEGEATGNPILDRYTEAEQSLVLQENL